MDRVLIKREIEIRDDFYQFYKTNKDEFDRAKVEFPDRGDYDIAMRTFFIKVAGTKTEEDFSESINDLYYLVKDLLKEDILSFFYNLGRIANSNSNLEGLEIILDKILLGFDADRRSSFKILIGPNIQELKGNLENRSYFHIYNQFPENCVLSTSFNEDECLSFLQDASESVIGIIGHGNETRGIKLKLKDDKELRLEDTFLDTMDLNKKSLLLLSCAYNYYVKSPQIDKIQYLLLSNKNMGPTRQELFLTSFLTAIKLGFNTESSFILGELCMSARIDQLEGTQLWKYGKMRMYTN